MISESEDKKVSEIISDQPNHSSSCNIRHLAKGIHRSLVILVILSLIAIGLIILPQPTAYYPNVVVETTDGVQIDFLLMGQPDKTACETKVAAITNSITSSCKECATLSQICIKNPTDEIKKRFGEAPLPVDSARIMNGVISYTAPKMDIALLACRESEQQALLKGNRSKVACYPAGSARPHTPFEIKQSEASHTTFTLFLALYGGLIISLVAVILAGYLLNLPLNNEQLAIKSHPLLEKFTLASVDTLILLGTFIAISWAL